MCGEMNVTMPYKNAIMPLGKRGEEEGHADV